MNFLILIPILSIALSLVSCGEKQSEAKQEASHASFTNKQPAWKSSAKLRYRVIKELPHDPEAFTQGLEIFNGHWLESTGLVGKSSLRKVEMLTGKPLKNLPLAGDYFGEGLTEMDGLIYQITWLHGKGFIYKADTFEKIKEFNYQGQGWGICNDGKTLFLSDGTSRIRLLDPKNMNVIQSIDVTWKGKPLTQLNELEYVEGEIFANLWGYDQIARIDPKSGKVIGLIDFSGIDAASPRRSPDQVLNGIAYDATSGFLYITGKKWPQIYQIQLLTL